MVGEPFPLGQLCIKRGELGFLWALCFRVQSPVVGGGQVLGWKAAPGEGGRLHGSVFNQPHKLKQKLKKKKKVSSPFSKVC